MFNSRLVLVVALGWCTSRVAPLVVHTPGGVTFSSRRTLARAEPEISSGLDELFAAQRAKDDDGLAAAQLDLFRRSRNQLVGDHAFVSAGVAALVWRFGSLSNAESYVLGAAFGGAYLVLLSRYVESVGKFGIEQMQSGGVGQARFAIVFLLVLLAGKNRQYLDFLPLLGGFFTYQLASILQAARPVDQDDLS